MYCCVSEGDFGLLLVERIEISIKSRLEMKYRCCGESNPMMGFKRDEGSPSYQNTRVNTALTTKCKQSDVGKMAS